MSEIEGFVVEYRKIMQWEWYTDVNTAHLFRHCILKANHIEKTWQGVKVKRGSFITSLQKLSTETGLTVKQVRTALEKLEKTGEVANCSTSKYRIITVNNYDCYQSEGKQKGKREGKQRAIKKADKGQSEGKQRATTNKYISNDIYNNETSGGVCPTGTHTPPNKKTNAGASSVTPSGGEPTAPLTQGEWRRYCEGKGHDAYEAGAEWIKVNGEFTEGQKQKVREWLRENGEDTAD